VNQPTRPKNLKGDRKKTKITVRFKKEEIHCQSKKTYPKWKPLTEPGAIDPVEAVYVGGLTSKSATSTGQNEYFAKIVGYKRKEGRGIVYLPQGSNLKGGYFQHTWACSPFPKVQGGGSRWPQGEGMWVVETSKWKYKIRYSVQPSAEKKSKRNEKKKEFNAGSYLEISVQKAGMESNTGPSRLNRKKGSRKKGKKPGCHGSWSTDWVKIQSLGKWGVGNQLNSTVLQEEKVMRRGSIKRLTSKNKLDQRLCVCMPKGRTANFRGGKGGKR